jgi:hypothetical protein
LFAENCLIIPDCANPGPIPHTVGTVPFRLDNFWTLVIGLENGRFFGELGEFGAFGKDWRLDEFWAIGRFLVNWKIQNQNPHWKFDFGKEG